MRSRIQLRYLQTFIAIVEEGTLSAAAERLFKSQSAVSQDLATLESEFRLTLIDRSGQRARLTTAGEILLPEARDVLSRVGELEASMHRIRSGDAGVVRIGSLPSLARQTAALVADFHEQNPGPRIELTRALQSALLDRLVRREVDIIIGLSVTRTDIDSVTLEHEPNYVVVNPSHPLANRTEVNALDLAEFPLVSVQRNMSSTRSAEYFFQSMGQHPEPVIEADDYSSIQILVRRGIGYSVLPRSVIADAVDLVALPMDPTVHRQVSAMRGIGRCSHAVTQAFDFLTMEWKRQIAEFPASTMTQR